MKTLRAPSFRSNAGFSLIELLVAMVVTLIVSGAIYGLLASGQSAFRREPELADRQQNIRIAMSLIEGDIERAGLLLPGFTQVFTGQDGPGATPDTLEIISARQNCPPVVICKAAPGPPAVLEAAVAPLPNMSCPGLPALVALTPGATIAPREMLVIGPASAVTGGAVCNAPVNAGLNAGPSALGMTITVQTNVGPPEWRTPRPATEQVGADPQPGNPQLMIPIEVIRYEIGPDANDLAEPNVPCLWRSSTGGRSPADGYATVRPKDEPNSPWQMVARGIEDLQVVYFSGTPVAPVTNPVAPGTPPVVVSASVPPGTPDYTTLVHRVQVTLSARVTAAMLAGQTGPGPVSSQRVRGRLTNQISPRAALLTLTQAPAGTNWN